MRSRSWFAASVLSVLAAVSCTPASTLRPSAAPGQVHVSASTLVPSVQKIAREALDFAVGEWAPATAVVVVLDAQTGAVLAMEGRDQGRDAPSLASQRAYVAGSTLATMTFAAALDARTIDIDAWVDCAPRRYGDAQLSDSTEFGSLPLTDALAVSSSVAASRVLDTLGLERLLAALKGLHIGDPPGSIPPIADASGIEAAKLATGEWAKTTPLQVAAAYATLLNGGLYMEPTFTKRAQPGVRVFRQETARAMRGLLEDVMESNLGTGRLARIEDVRVAGKTGTAVLEDGRSYASFVGTVVGWKPPFVVLVGLEAPRDGGTGGSAAAPIFARIARRLVGV
jgi:cell division protein FtsI (penicillin-binding protein 3)